jgi:hypothetical protein
MAQHHWPRKYHCINESECPHLQGQAVIYRNKKCVQKFGLKFSNEKTTWQAPGMDESKVSKFVLEKLCMRVQTGVDQNQLIDICTVWMTSHLNVRTVSSYYIK